MFIPPSERIGSAAMVLGVVALSITIDPKNASTAEETVIVGPASVIDGRVLSIDRTRVLLKGVDAAEPGTF
jgi:hypothetical protein